MFKFLFKKDDRPFKVGQVVSNGSERKVVNAVFKDFEGNYKMLIDEEIVWTKDSSIAKMCDEVFCKDYYLVK